MDIAFLRAIASLENTNEPFCVIKKDEETHAYTKLLTTYCDISDVPPNTFATGYQNYDGKSGVWCTWGNITRFQNTGATERDIELIDLKESLNWSNNIEKEKYLEICKTMIEEMERGDYFLANLTRKISTEIDVDPISVAVNSAFEHDCEFRYFFYSPDFSYLSLSPERFVSIKDGIIVSQPIKGTAKTFRELDESIKDKEENTMIVDLVRADFSKIVEPKSMRVKSFQDITSHPGLKQMSSTISAKLSKDFEIRSCIKELMPIASVTGTPKPRVLKKINEHENYDRGIYCGAIGWIDTEVNECDLSVAIRGIHFQKSKVTIGIGAGITHKSNPELEYKETELKASRLIQLLEKSIVPPPHKIFTTTKARDKKIFSLRKHLQRIDCSEALTIPDDGIVKISKEKNGSLHIETNSNSEAFSKFKSVGIALSALKAPKGKLIKSEPRYIYERMFNQGRLCAKENIDDVLIVKDGAVLESTKCNVFARFGREIFTPPLDGLILNGILRQLILEQFDLFGFEIKESSIKVKNLVFADELILTNSVRGASSISNIDSNLFDDLNRFTPKEAIASEYFEELFNNNFEDIATEDE